MRDNYKSAYTEVLEILKHVPEEETKKIPEIIMLFLEENKDNTYEYTFNADVPINEQPISNITKSILANFYRDYIALPEEREEILEREKYELQEYERVQREKYPPDDVFKNRQRNIVVNQEENQFNHNLPVVIEETNIFTKLINFIKNIFK